MPRGPIPSADERSGRTSLPARPWVRTYWGTHSIRLLVALGVLGLAPLLPGASSGERLTFVALVVGSMALFFVLRSVSARNPGTAAQVGILVLNVLLVFAFQVLVPPMRPAVAFGYTLLVAVHSALEGLIAGLLIAAAGGALTVVTHVAWPGPQDADAFQVCVYLAAAVGIAFMLDRSTSEQRRLLDELDVNRRELARALEREREIAERLREADRVKGEIVSGVSHEFRTPLTAIRGFTETLITWGGRMEPDRSGELLLHIERNARELQRLVEQFLDYSRLDSGWTELHRETIELAGWIEGFVEARSPMLASHRIGISVPPGLCARADPDALERILGNLLDNAVRYSPAGAAVFVAAAHAGGAVLVSVRDEGSGIPEELRDRIFEPFYRDAPSGRRGTGLGLAVARRYVSLHGGRIWVESPPGAGATFRFTLPGAALEAAS